MRLGLLRLPGFPRRWLATARAWLLQIFPPRRRTRVRARTILLCMLIGVAVLHFGFLYVIDRSPELRDPVFHKRMAMLRNQLAKTGDPNPAVVVMFGTSRTGNAFDARTCQEALTSRSGRQTVAINYGIAGIGPVMQQVHLRRILANGIKPDLVVLEVLPCWFMEFGGKPHETPVINPDHVTGEEIELLARYRVPVEPFRKRWREIQLNPWGELRDSILLKVRPTFLPRHAAIKWNEGCDEWGWRPLRVEQFDEATYQRYLAIARSELAPGLAHFQFGREALQALSDTLDLCRQEGIRVQVIHLPEDGTFRKWYGPGSRELIRATFARVAREHGAEWIDATEWIPDGNFIDGHHLLESGAAIFTRRLVNDHLAPAMRSERRTASARLH